MSPNHENVVNEPQIKQNINIYVIAYIYIYIIYINIKLSSKYLSKFRINMFPYEWAIFLLCRSMSLYVGFIIKFEVVVC